MNFKLRLGVTVVAMVMLVAASAAAKSKDAKDLLLHYDATVAGSHLVSGSYSITWETHSPAATVSFLQKGKVVATAEGKVVDRGTKYPSNEVVFAATADGGRQVQEIRFRGSSEVIVFVE